MKPRACFAAALLLFVASCASSSSPARHATGSDDPVAVVNAFVAALCNADLDSLVATFADDATVFTPIPSVPQRVAGKAAIRQAFAPFLESLRATGGGPPYMSLNPREVEVRRFDQTAIVTFHLGQLPSADGHQPTSFSRRSFVLRYASGRWLIVHLHGSNVVVH